MIPFLYILEPAHICLRVADEPRSNLRIFIDIWNDDPRQKPQIFIIAPSSHNQPSVHLIN